jgi:phosphoglycerate dehydrogenase-like enzyme
VGLSGGPVVWIPETTPQHYRSFLPDGIEVRDIPSNGPIPDAPQRADILINAFDPRRAIEVMPQLRDLKVVQVLSAGVDIIAPHIPAGVTLCDGSGIHDASVSDWVVMGILAVLRQIPDHMRSQQERVWRFVIGDDLEGKTVLIVGYGSIGRATERRLEPFGVRTIRVARHARDGVHGIDELPRLLPDADVVVILVPLTDETRGMVGAEFLSKMQDNAILVNAARGAPVVTEPEPLPDGHPLWSAPGVLITPHIGGAVRHLFERGWRFAGEQVRRYMNGEQLRNVVSDGY